MSFNLNRINYHRYSKLPQFIQILRPSLNSRRGVQSEKKKEWKKEKQNKDKKSCEGETERPKDTRWLRQTGNVCSTNAISQNARWENLRKPVISVTETRWTKDQREGGLEVYKRTGPLASLCRGQVTWWSGHVRSEGNGAAPDNIWKGRGP